MLLSISISFLPLVLASPLSHARRAGAPIPKPIPSNCTLQQIHPSNTSSSSSFSTHFRPGTSALSSQIYQYNLARGVTSPDGTGPEQPLITTCLETCYGYGNPGDCTSVFYAKNVTYTAYGYTNVADFACLLFSKALGAGDLSVVTAQEGMYIDAGAVDIVCKKGTCAQS